jgi:glycosyltransferase involved in cell wall biosynthesis
MTLDQDGRAMRLLALVESPDHVCCRYRLAAFRPHLEAHGHYLETTTWPGHWWDWAPALRRARQADAVVVQRKLPARWQRSLLRRVSKYLHFDFDDAIFGRDSYAARGFHSTRRLRRFAGICRAADAVIAGNGYLRDAAARWTAAGRVHVVPTCVEPGQYPLARHERGRDIVQLVWLGSSSTLRGLEAIRSLLEQLGQGVTGLRLKLVCDRFFQLEHLPVEAVRWTETGEAAELASADIGISWMPDDDWSRGKCGLKVLQYMAAGLPVVANPVGVHCEMVRHGESGYLAETATQWKEAIGRLAGDPGLRRRMGATGRRRVEAEYSVTRGAEAWTSILDRLDERSAAA